MMNMCVSAWYLGESDGMSPSFLRTIRGSEITPEAVFGPKMTGNCSLTCSNCTSFHN